MAAKSFVPGQAWGPQSGSHIATSSPARGRSGKGARDISCDPPIEKHDGKPSHDASIFVGSLPCNIDQVELTRMLTEHLAEYAEVKGIKVVRDSKGGICAFVQCEDAHAASNLIQTLHNEKPKPFMGRILRFEPARAFRTLLISYRAPSYTASDPASRHAHPIQTVHNLELPTAMRIWKLKGARFHNIAYNADAFAQEANATGNDVESDDILFLHPLSFDEDTMRTMASYFGRVEKVTPYQFDDAQPELVEHPSDGGLTRSYPPPHDAPRSPIMDTRCWEVKWDFRDDCVSALMALRRVPHLTVTWAHQPSYSGWECRYPSFSNFPHTTHPTYMANHPLPSPSSFASVTPSFLNSSNSISHLYHSVAREGDVSLGHSEHLSRDSVLHGSQATVPLTEQRNGWNIWRPPTSASPSFGPSGLYPTSQVYTGDRNSDVPSTPKTPSSVYPLTPTSCTDDEKPLNYAPELQEVSSQRSIDPTSLFVGGLEIVGPSAWDDDKVRQHFSKYGGLQHVKLVRPLNGVAGFAFLKFDNVDGPARAVLEEHNRVCGSHVLRVRLRDCNPPRNPWKHGRGRGKLFHHNGPGYRKFHFMDRFNYMPQPRRDNGISQEASATSPAGITRSPSPSRSIDQHSVPGDSESHLPSDSEDSSSPAPDGQEEEGPQRYREWYDELDAAAARPAHHALSGSQSTAMFPPPYPYMFHHVPYYGQPGPWVQSYIHPQAHYPSPYFNPYPVYPPMMHSPGQPLPGEPGQAVQHNWSPQGVVYPKSPHYGYPCAPRPPAENQAKSPTSNGVNCGNSSPPQADPAGAGSIAAPPGLPSKMGQSPDCSMNARPQAVNPAPFQPQVLHPQVFAQPPAQPWSGLPPMITSPAHFVQAHIPMQQPSWMQLAPPHSVQGNGRQFHRQQQPRTSKRQAMLSAQGQTGFPGNKNMQQQQRTPHRGNVQQQMPPVGIPPGLNQPSVVPNRQPVTQEKQAQPPVWI